MVRVAGGQLLTSRVLVNFHDIIITLIEIDAVIVIATIWLLIRVSGVIYGRRGHRKSVWVSCWVYKAQCPAASIRQKTMFLLFLGVVGDPPWRRGGGGNGGSAMA